jgi:hypothetical protein
MRKWENKRLTEYYEGEFFKNLMKLSSERKKWRDERGRLDECNEVGLSDPRA